MRAWDFLPQVRRTKHWSWLRAHRGASLFLLGLVKKLGAEVLAVSSRTGEGLERLRGALEAVADALSSRAEAVGAARLHIDRVFTIRGAGTVLTARLPPGDPFG